MRLLVCGGRTYGVATATKPAHQAIAERVAVRATLDAIHAQDGIAVLIHGAAPGADRLGASWAASRGIPVDSYPAEWQRLGRAAGPARNGRMLAHGKPDLVVAFKGHAGTANMIEQARAAGVAVWEV